MSILYSKTYVDDVYEYRHVILDKAHAAKLPVPPRLLDEKEWRALDIQQSMGWEHYMIHDPEPHILLFRRKIGTDPCTGLFLCTVPANKSVVEGGGVHNKQ
jgi:cyclin-dependent kinase regulatory subunit CKS1